MRKQSPIVTDNNRYETLPLYFILATLCLITFVSRAALYFPAKILVISIFLCTAPNILMNCKQLVSRLPNFDLETAIVLEFLFLFFMSLLPSIVGFVVITVVTTFGIFYTSKKVTENFVEELKKLPDIVGVVILAILLSHFFWFRGFYTFDTKTKILDGYAQADTLYHVAIANMIRTEHIPSTGLNFAPYSPYHYLSHIIFAVISKIIDTKMYLVYSYAIPFLLFPPLIQVLRSLIKKYTPVYGHFLVLIFILFGFTSYGFSSIYSLYGVDFVSESQILGAIVLFAFLDKSVGRISLKTKSLLILIGFLSKISIGVLLFLTEIFLVIFDQDSTSLISAYSHKKNVFVDKIIRLAVLSASALVGFLLTVIIGGADAGQGQAGISLSNLSDRLKTDFPSLSPAAFFLTLFHVALLTIILYLINKKDLTKKPHITYFVTFVISFVIGIISVFWAPAGWVWFALLSMWVSIPILLILVMNMIISKSWAKRNLTYAIFIFLFLTNVSVKFVKTWRENAAYPKNKYALTKKGEKLLPYFEALENAGKFDKQNQYVIEIPRTEGDFWEQNNYASFEIPAISGRPAKGASYWERTESIPAGQYYEYAKYWNQPGIDLCKDTKYKGIIRIWKDDRGEVISKNFDCDQFGNIAQLTPTAKYFEYNVRPYIVDKTVAFVLGYRTPSNYVFNDLENLRSKLQLPVTKMPTDTFSRKVAMLQEILVERNISKPIDRANLLTLRAVENLEKAQRQNDPSLLSDYESRLAEAIHLFKRQVDFDNNFIKNGAGENDYFEGLRKEFVYLDTAEEQLSNSDSRKEITSFNDNFRQWAKQGFFEWCSYTKLCVVYQASPKQKTFYISDNGVSVVNYGVTYDNNKPLIQDPVLWDEIEFNKEYHVNNMGTIVFKEGAVVYGIVIPENTKTNLFMGNYEYEDKKLLLLDHVLWDEIELGKEYHQDNIGTVVFKKGAVLYGILTPGNKKAELLRDSYEFLVRAVGQKLYFKLTDTAPIKFCELVADQKISEL